MRKIISSEVALIAAANTLMLAGIFVWWSLSDGFAMTVASPIMFVFFCASLFFPRLRRAWRRPPSNRCELCRNKLIFANDDMRWAEYYGLLACDSCSFKLHIAFGDPDAKHRSHLLH